MQQFDPTKNFVAMLLHGDVYVPAEHRWNPQLITTRWDFEIVLFAGGDAIHRGTAFAQHIGMIAQYVPAYCRMVYENNRNENNHNENKHNGTTKDLKSFKVIKVSDFNSIQGVRLLKLAGWSDGMLSDHIRPHIPAEYTLI